MSDTKVVSACVAIDNGRVLLPRHAPGQKLEGMWEFPGGKLEDGESIQERLERELLEELDEEIEGLTGREDCMGVKTG